MMKRTNLLSSPSLSSTHARRAGAVRQKADQRGTASDFMEMEQERGISISSTVMNFEYEGHGIRLMDTPGHQDFSEDTYRALAAADNAVRIVLPSIVLIGWLVVKGGRSVQRNLSLTTFCPCRGYEPCFVLFVFWNDNAHSSCSWTEPRVWNRRHENYSKSVACVDFLCLPLSTNSIVPLLLRTKLWIKSKKNLD